MSIQASVIAKLTALRERGEEVELLLRQPEINADPARLRDLTVEYKRLQGVTAAFTRWQRTAAALREAEEVLAGADADLKALAAEEIPALRRQLPAMEHELRLRLLPPDPRDDCSCFIEIRAGTGGDEAALFAGQLFRMYAKYVEARRWQMEIVSASPGEMGGYKEIIAKLCGDGAYGRLKFESGGHRVQRVPITEAQGRVHTSAVTVMVLPEIPPAQAPQIKPEDLRVDTFRSSGAGGQHINKTDSAIRITHLPTGIVVECQDQRSQHQNRARAMEVLYSRLVSREEARRAETERAARHSILSSGARSDRIRTYNFPQSRVTDHRLNLTLHRLTEILDGDLDLLLQPLTEAYRAEQLQAAAPEQG